jgi:formate dehydrogenase major subunit
VVKKYSTPMDKYGTPSRDSHRLHHLPLTEHYHYWTKNNPMNVQLIPEMFVEIPMDLAGRARHQGRRST